MTPWKRNKLIWMRVCNGNYPVLLLDTLIQCDINPYKHQLNLPWDLVPWVVVLRDSKNLPTHIMYHFYIICHMLRHIASSTPAVGHKDQWTKTRSSRSGARVPGFLCCRSVYMFSAENKVGPHMLPQLDAALLQTLVHIMWGGCSCRTLQHEVDPTCLGFNSI